MQIETIKLETCPICKSGEIERVISGQDFESASGDYDIYVCQTCLTGFTNPQPLASELEKLYEDRSTPDFPTPPRIVAAIRGAAVARTLKKLFSKYRPGRIQALDFGCGDGFVTAKLSEFAECERIVAVDFHAFPPPLLTGISPSRVSYQNLFSFTAAGDAAFDLVFCRHVLEHVHAPLDFLRMIKRKMKPGALLFVELPNFASVWRKIFGKYFFGLYLPRHLYHFTADSLHYVLTQAGFDVLEIRKGHTPMLPATLTYLTGIKLKNLGLLGLFLLPVQILLDKAFGESSTLIALARAGGESGTAA